MGKGGETPFCVCDNHRFEWFIEAERQWIVTLWGWGTDEILFDFAVFVGKCWG